MDLLQTESLADLLVRSTVLWRACSWDDNQEILRLEDFPFEPAKHSKNSVLAKVVLGRSCIDEPVVVPMTDLEGNSNPGVLAFVDEQPPPDWTFLVVTVASKRLREHNVMERGGAIHVKFARNLSANRYLEFRNALARYGKGKGSRLNTLSAKITRAHSYMTGTSLTRCIIHHVGDDGVFCKYHRFKDNPGSTE